MPCSPEFSVESCYTSPTTENQKEKKDCHGHLSINQELDNTLEDFRMAVKGMETKIIIIAIINLLEAKQGNKTW